MTDLRRAVVADEFHPAIPPLRVPDFLLTHVSDEHHDLSGEIGIRHAELASGLQISVIGLPVQWDGRRREGGVISIFLFFFSGHLFSSR